MELKDGTNYAPPWIMERLEGGSPNDGPKELNQRLSGDGKVTTHPTRTVTSVFNKGSQRRHG
jgi:hypothetical protein